MMKTFCGIGALAFAFALPLTGHAQQRLIELSVGGGPSVPMGEFGDEAKLGGHGQFAIGLNPTALPLQIRGAMLFQTFYSADRENSINRTVGGEWYRQLSWMADLVYGKQMGSVRPYGLIGGGYLREWHDDRTYYPDSHTTANLNAGAGVDFPLLRVTGFVEARFLNLLGGKALPTRPPAVLPEVQFRSIPITIGFKFPRSD